MRVNRFHFKLIALLISASLAWIFWVQNASAQTPTSTPVVRAVLFFRSTCSYCQQLVEQVLPPILDKYESQTQIFYCDVSKPEGDILFTAAINHYVIKTIGVPTVIVGKNVLIGSINIQRFFPKIIEDGLSQGGLDWPEIPGLSQVLSTADALKLPIFTSTNTEFLPPLPASTPAAAPQNSNVSPIILEMEWMENNFTRDLQGNTLSVIILIGMLISVIFGIYTFLEKSGRLLPTGPVWLTPVLSVLGCGVAGYLWYVEATMVQAICGPIGHCQTVQESEYSRLFGILPIGALGVAGYVAIIITWLIGRTWRSKWAELAGLVLLGISALGTLFSIYLTFLEPFVIGASCLWCLTSAVLMTALFYLNIAPGKLAYTHLLKKPGVPAIPGSS